MAKIGKKFKNISKQEMGLKSDHMLKSFFSEWKSNSMASPQIKTLNIMKLAKTANKSHRISKRNPRKAIIIPISLAKCTYFYLIFRI